MTHSMFQSTQTSMNKSTRKRKLLWVAALPALVGVLFLGWYLGARFVWFNLHTVVPGQVYRSAQPSQAFLDKTVQADGIRCILKLNSPKESTWSHDEAAEASRLGVKMINLTMAVTRLPTRAELLALIDAISTAPRPLLIHCKFGADRTGVASTLLAMHDGASFDEATAAQLSWKYFHLGHWGPAIEDVVERYRQFRDRAGLPTGGWAEFVDYARNSYDPAGDHAPGQSEVAIK